MSDPIDIYDLVGADKTGMPDIGLYVPTAALRWDVAGTLQQWWHDTYRGGGEWRDVQREAAAQEPSK